MEQKTTKRREWVKNAAIVFLSVLLVLTFFSNTIMNYSLPEVATEYVQSGTITAKIRGTGTVEAEDPYSVIVGDTRVISSVQVKQGDIVEKGDVLYMLEDKESEELEAALLELEQLELDLDSAILQFEKQILDGSLSAGTIAGVQSGNGDTLATAQAKVQAAKNKLNALLATKESYEASIADITTQQALMDNSESYSKTLALQQLNAAQAELETAQAKVTELEAWFGTAGSQTDATAAMINSEQAMLQTGYVYEAIRMSYDTWDADDDDRYTEADNATITGGANVSADDIIGSIGGLVGSNWSAILTLKEGEYNTAVANYNAAKMLADNYSIKQSELTDAQAVVTSAQQKVTNCQLLVDNYEQGTSAAQKAALEQQKIQLEAAITDVELQIQHAQKEQEQVLTDVAGELALESQNDAIARAREKVLEQQEEVAKLQKDAQNAVIVAPVSGTVTSMNYVAGQSTVAGEAAAVIQVEGKGYTLSFSVTKEQAQKVRVGDVAELQDSWYYGDVTATLTAIKADPTNPTQNKLLVFSLQGEDITPGQSLSLSVGQKSAEYSLTVPNSAIREDNNGKFILIVESKSSPLGNRYIATRIDVEVLASDDTRSAISEVLYGYEYVITTATKPVEAGQQVRLTE